MRGKVARRLQSLTSMIVVITVSWMPKATHVSLFRYLELKAHLTTIISMYYMIYESDTYTAI